MQNIIYIRKSTNRKDKQVTSLEDQRKVLERLALRHGHKIDLVISEEKTAKDPLNRPNFERLMKLIEKGMVSNVYTWEFDRTARNMVDGGRFAHALQIGKLKSIVLPTRTYTQEDSSIALAVEIGLATDYIRRLSRNVKRGMDEKAGRGWHPNKAPIGYINDKNSRHILPHPRNFAIVQRIFELAATGGYTLLELRLEATRLGLASTRAGCAGKPYSKSVFASLLKNPFYKGTLVYKGEHIEGKHKPAVSAAIFDKVQRVMRKDGNVRRLEIPFVLRGSLKCSHCGCAVVGERKTKTLADGTVRTYNYYHCSGMKGCKRVCISEEKAVEVLKTHLDSIALAPSEAMWVEQAFAMILEDDTTLFSASAANLEHQRGEAEKRLARLRELRLDGELEAEEYAEEKRKLNSRLNVIQEKLSEATGALQTMLEYVKSQLDFTTEVFSYSGIYADDFLRRAIRTGFQRAEMDGRAVVLRYDPVLQKIASFEPLRKGSQCPEPGDLLAPNSVWSKLALDIRTIVDERVLAQDGENVPTKTS